MKTKSSIHLAKSVAFALLLFFSVAVQAQQADKTEAATRLTDKMKTELTLSEEQYPKVYEANLSFINKAAEAKAAGGGKISMLKKLKALDQERDGALKAVLTDAQFKSFEALKKENRSEMKKQFKKNN